MSKRSTFAVTEYEQVSLDRPRELEVQVRVSVGRASGEQNGAL